VSSPDSRASRIAEIFVHHEGAALLASRFLPGPNLAAVIAGFSTISLVRFLLLDAVVSLLWAGLYLAGGHLLPLQILYRINSVLGHSPGWSIFIISGLAALVYSALPLRRHLPTRTIGTLARSAHPFITCAHTISIALNRKRYPALRRFVKMLLDPLA
jgi:membrane protein DedA with SNARE-associated domain